MDASNSELQLHSRTGKGEGETVGIALLGFGTVGAEVFRLLDENADAFAHRIGGPAEIRGIAIQNKNRLRPGVPNELLTDDAKALISRDDIDMVVEVIGGIDFPRELVLTALNSGKSVVTANKALVAAHADELAEAAERSGVDLYFEAAVAAVHDPASVPGAYCLSNRLLMPLLRAEYFQLGRGEPATDLLGEL